MMRANKNRERYLKNPGYQKETAVIRTLWEITLVQKLGCLVLIILCAGIENAWAIGNDALSAGVTTAETILTGSMMRLIVIAGSIFGVIKAYMASSPLLMGGSIAIGIGISLLMDWVKATWAILI